MLDGAVVHVSADASEAQGRKDEAGHSGAAYRALVKLDSQHLEVGGARLPLSAGMQVIAEIKQGERTVLEYLLSPAQKTVHEAARER
jgi:HlyD family secretion protein